MTAGQFIGVDVGGTKIAVATLDDGRLAEPEVHPTRLDSQDALVEQLVEVIGAARTDRSQAVGIGVPSVVDFESGRIQASANIPLADLPLRALLSERIGMPVYVDNDANCAALAEAFEDGRLVCPDLVMFTVGTGVGGGLVLNGRLYRGATGAAAEVGHTVIGLGLTAGAAGPDRFPAEGSLERLASGRALDLLAGQLGAEKPGSFLGRRLVADGEVTGHDVVDGAREEDPESLDALRVLGERLGIGIANAINTFDPAEVVIGGGVSVAGELLLAPARDAAWRYVLPGVGSRTSIRTARHGVDAGLLGAALIAAQEHPAPAPAAS